MIGFVALMLGCLGFIVFYVYLRRVFQRRLQMEKRLKSISDLKIIDENLADERLNLPLRERVLNPLLKSTGKRLQRLAPSSLKDGMGGKLAMAGLKVTPEQYAGWHVVGAMIGLGFGLLLSLMSTSAAAMRLMTCILLALAGGAFPGLLLRSKIQQRQRKIVQDLPDALDLLTVSVKAGLGFDSAVLRVTEKMKGPLSQELGKVLHEVKAGIMRKDALRSMAERTGVKELQAFVGTMIQADQLGVSISNVLQIQSDSLREERRQAAEEKAMKAPVKMLFPLVIFIFPTLFIVLLGPAMLQILASFAGM